jgi:hypothetical protein
MEGMRGDVRKPIDAYLDAVDSALAAAGMSRTDRRNITDDVEAQILEMLAARAGDSPTEADVEVVLAELDPPEAYVADTAPSTPPDAVPPAAIEPRFSGTAIVGAAWAPCFFLVAVVYMMCFQVKAVEGAASPGLAWWQYVLRFTLLLVGLTAPFGTTILGIVAISQIRHSAGRLCGMGLAVFDALLFPLLLLATAICGLLFFAIFVIRNLASHQSPDPKLILSLLLAMVVCVIVGILIVVWVWRAATPSNDSSRIGTG